MQIPGTGDIPPPRVIAPTLPAEQEAAGEVKHLELRKRRSSKSTSRSSDPNWEKSQKLSRSRRMEVFGMRGMLIAGVLVFAAIVSGLVLLMRDDVPAVANREKSPTEEATPKVTSPRPLVSKNEVLTPELAEPLAKQFLEATTVDNLLPLVRNPKVVESRMKDFYEGGRVQPAGLLKFNVSEAVTTKGDHMTFSVLTRDQGEKQICFVTTPDGIKVDWESWVGWSDISWQKFLSTKPSTSHTFRVIVSPVDYYNFGFSDESKWQSYRLESPDMEHGLYGYVARDSELINAMRLNADQTTAPFILTLRFPPDSNSNTQVEIEKLICEGWVE
jgi:hypothetical protein